MAGLGPHLLGGLCALGAGACWALASVIFGRLGRTVAPLGLNLGKGLLALACLGAALGVDGLEPVGPRAWLLLGASGLVGIALGDTVFFQALRRLGPRRTLLMTTLIPALVALLSFALLGERLEARAWLGALVTVAGVTWTLWERLPEGEDAGSWRQGIGYGLLTVATCAAAVMFSKVALAEVRPLQATAMRLLCAVLALLGWGLARGQLLTWLSPLRERRTLLGLCLAAFVGTFLGMWLSQASLWFTSATVATILSATDPIFVLPLAALVMGERLRLRPVLGALLSLAGVALLLARQGP